jgi:protein MpaA
LFQEELIFRLRPQKILSIHSPLNHLDYDGPSPLSLSKFPTEYMQICEKLKRRLNAKSSGYFPGSLGNYAGQELGIPTLTLELPTAKPERAAAYWKEFTGGIWTMIRFAVPSFASGYPGPKIGSDPRG